MSLKSIELTKEEQALEKAIEKGDYVKDQDFLSRKKAITDAALDYSMLNTTQLVSIRIKRADLVKVKLKASQSGIPYQTLIGSIVHKYDEE